jgi:hypothetical protein
MVPMTSNNSTMGQTRSVIVPLLSSGANVRSWESSVSNGCRELNAACLLLPDYGMHVSSQHTLALDLARKVERGIIARRAESVAEARYVNSQKNVSVKQEVIDGVPSLERRDFGLRSAAAVEVAEVKLDGAEIAPILKINTVLDPDVQEIKADKQSMSDERERKMRARAVLISERLQKRLLLTERRGTNLTVFFLDPTTALELDDECDREMVCHEHTLEGESLCDMRLSLLMMPN